MNFIFELLTINSLEQWKKVVNNKFFNNLKNDMDEVLKQFKSIENDVNQNVYDKYQLHQYEQIIEGNDEDVLTQYETMYDKFAEVIINKNNVIEQANDSFKQINYSINHINDMIEYIKKLTNTNDANSIINKEMNNANTMIKCLNQIVDKMLEKETTIFNRKEQKFEEQKQKRKQEFEEKQIEINNMKLNYHNTEEVERKQKQQHIEEIKFQNDIELEQLNNSLESLLEWSGKQNYNIIFDSKIDGDGKGMLATRVLDKKDLYFITFDNENNIFGGYMNELINEKNTRIADSKSFVFSLLRNGMVKKREIRHNKKEEINAFYLHSYRDYLYVFGYNGGDIVVFKINDSSSWCSLGRYKYNGDKHTFTDHYNFVATRILVLEMM